MSCPIQIDRQDAESRTLKFPIAINWPPIHIRQDDVETICQLLVMNKNIIFLKIRWLIAAFES